MPLRMTHVNLALALTAGCASMLACNHALPPAAIPLEAAPAVAGTPAVVFVRPVSPCDTGDYTIIVDDRGQFLGDVSPGTQLAVPVAPGRHVFYAWSNLDLRVEKIPAFNPIAATFVDVAHDPEYVALEVNRLGFNCSEFALVDLVPVPRSGPRWGEVERWLARAQPIAADRGAGQAALDRRPVYVALNLDLGRAKLRAEIDARAAREQHEALRAERDEELQARHPNR